jgi:3D (Asp-Asp-Asp) domain-containing protein
MNIQTTPSIRPWALALASAAVLCSAPALAAPAVTLSGFTYTGITGNNGCPAGSATAALQPSTMGGAGDELVVKFNHFTVPDVGGLWKRCHIDVQIQPPVGFKLTVSPSGYHVIEGAKTTATLKTHTSYAGSPQMVWSISGTNPTAAALMKHPKNMGLLTGTHGNGCTPALPPTTTHFVDTIRLDVAGLVVSTAPSGIVKSAHYQLHLTPC